MNAPVYTTEILRLAASLPPPAANFGTADCAAMRRSPTCGSSLTVAVKLDQERRIAALSQEVHACAFGQASAAILAHHAVGRDRGDITAAYQALADWLAGSRGDPGDWPGLEALAPARAKTGRHGAILLPFRTLLAAMDEVA
ncbi:MAG TPA: iron-sulfur cluster assembly scaffold protein [Sphingomicrobium sp.]|nr:iron-sulfur cluster assembly scaffold protein [Sphingomicrobium sp.]